MKFTGVFNGPLEAGLRALVLLDAAYPQALDLYRLVTLDYLLVHSGDISNGPESLHPPSPMRAGEVAIRKGLLEDGLSLYRTRGLIQQLLSSDGIRYVADDSAAVFLDALSESHTLLLRQRADWLLQTLGSLNDLELQDVLDSSLGRWRTEFALLPGTEIE